MKTTVAYTIIFFVTVTAVSFAGVNEQALNELLAKKAVEEKSTQMFRCDDGYTKTATIAEVKKQDTLTSGEKKERVVK